MKKSRAPRPWYFRLFDRMRSWFVSWRDLNIGNTTVIVIAKEIEDLEGAEATPAERKVARLLKGRIQAAAKARGVEPHLAGLLERHVDPKGRRHA